MNFYQLHYSDSLNNELSLLQNQIRQDEKLSSRFDEYKFLEDLKITHSEIPTISFNNKVLVFFSDHGCKNCVKNEVQILNNIKKNTQQEIEVYLLRIFDAEFQYSIIDPLDNVFNKEFEFDNPVAVIVDSIGNVKQIHFAEIGKVAKSEYFYTQIVAKLN